MSRKKHTFFLNFFLLISVLILSLIGVELFCYFYLHLPVNNMPSLVYFDPSQKPSKRLVQNANKIVDGAYREFRYQLTTDQFSFRKTYPFENNLKTYSVAILGDSQSFGVGVNDEQTFASLIAKNLGESVLNTGCPGYNTIEEFLTYKNRVQQLQPRHVLLFFFSGNDPYENYKNRELYYGKTKAQPLVQKPQNFSSFSLMGLKDFLSKHSAIYNSLIKLRQVPQINRFLYHFKLVNPAPPPELAIFQKDENPDALVHWRMTEELIKKLRDEVESNGSQFWLIFIPDRYQVDPIYWQKWVSKYQLNPQDYDLTHPNRHLAEFSRKNGIQFEDVTEALIKTKKEGKNVYWKIDAHLNILGNQVVADFITSRLSQQDELISLNKEKIS